MPLTVEEQVKVQTFISKHPDAGRRKIAKELGLSEKMVRNYLETIGEPDDWDELEHYRATKFGAVPIVIYCWDIETTSLKSDIGEVRVASFLNMQTGEIHTRTSHDFAGDGDEKGLVNWIRNKVAEADILIGQNSKSFDKNFINGVLARYDMDPLPPRFHWDTMLVAQYGLKGRLQSVSMDNLADFFRLPMSKDKPSKHDWREFIAGDPDAVARIVERCEADVKVTALLYDRLKRYHHKWKGE